MIDPATLRKLLLYNPHTGALTWKRRTAELHPNDSSRKAFNSKFANGPAFFTYTGNGYLQGSVFNIIYKTHRVAWAIHYGEWPNVIDHINHVKSDNRISNLRSVTHSENLRNASMPSTNTSGHVGVSWIKNRSKWKAQIKVNQKQIYLGRFHDKDDAIKARKAAEVKYGFHKNHGRDAT